jgi:ferredoxin
VDCIHFTNDKDIGEGAMVDGFDPEGKQLYIDPEECIDCNACEPECPVEAIFAEDDVPEEWNKYIKMNYEFFGQEAPQ